MKQLVLAIGLTFLVIGRWGGLSYQQVPYHAFLTLHHFIKFHRVVWKLSWLEPPLVESYIPLTGFNSLYLRIGNVINSNIVSFNRLSINIVWVWRYLNILFVCYFCWWINIYHSWEKNLIMVVSHFSTTATLVEFYFHNTS